MSDDCRVCGRPLALARDTLPTTDWERIHGICPARRVGEESK